MVPRRGKGLTDPRSADDAADAAAKNASAIAKADGYGMDMLSRVFDGTYIEKADAPKSKQIVDPFENLYSYGGAVIPPLDPYRMLQLIENNAVHSACITAKSADAVGRGWVWEPESKEPEDPLAPKRYDEMLEKITPGMSFSDLLRQAIMEKETVGWSAWEVARSSAYDMYTGREPVLALFPIPSHTIRATQNDDVWVQIKNVEVRYFKRFGCKDAYDARTGQIADARTVAAYLKGSARVNFEPAREIIVFKTYTPRSPYYGIPTWIGALPSIAELQAIREFNVSFFQSGGTSDRIIHVTDEETETAEKLAKDVMQSIKEAAGRGHTTIVTHGKTTTQVQAIPMNGPTGQVGGRDAQFVKRRDDLVKEVLMAHSVPPYRIGWAEIGSLGGSAAKEMLRTYKVGTIEPNQTLLEEQLTATLFGPEGMKIEGYKWKLQTLDWDETDMNLAIATNGVQVGLITRNEGRDLLGRQRFEDPAMDQPTSSSQVMPLTSTEEAKALKEVIGEWKTALLTVLRAPAPLQPPMGMPPGPGGPMPPQGVTGAPPQGGGFPSGAAGGFDPAAPMHVEPVSPVFASEIRKAVAEAMETFVARIDGRIEKALERADAPVALAVSEVTRAVEAIERSLTKSAEPAEPDST